MANDIQNRLHIEADPALVSEIFSAIASTYEDGPVQIDFQKIIPRPKELDLEFHSGIETWAMICTGQLNFKSFLSNAKAGNSFGDAWSKQGFDSMINYMKTSVAFETLLGDRGENVANMPDKDFEEFIQSLRNWRKHRFYSWYEWSNENWGTKWNAYGQDDSRNTENTIFYQTANGKSIPVVKQLSKMYPSALFTLTWADEDSGSNTGSISFQNGKTISEYKPINQSTEAYNLFFELHPDRVSEYKLVDGKYEYVEED